MIENPDEPREYHEPLSVTVEVKVKRALEGFAERTGKTKSWLVNAILKPALGLIELDSDDDND